LNGKFGELEIFDYLSLYKSKKEKYLNSRYKIAYAGALSIKKNIFLSLIL